MESQGRIKRNANTFVICLTMCSYICFCTNKRLNEEDTSNSVYFAEQIFAQFHG